MTDLLTDPVYLRAVIAALAVAAVAGPVGCFVVWRRMAYFGDSLAHTALLGVGLGMIFHFNITVGAIASAVLMAVMLLALRRQRGLATDTLLGVLSHTGLALGLIAISIATGEHADHMDILFGDVFTISNFDAVGVWIAAALVLVAVAILWRDLIAISVHEDLAKAEGVKVWRVEFAFILLLAVMTASAMKVVGLLLITALLIIPAAAARRLSRGPEQMALIAAAIAAVAVVAGLFGAHATASTSGPTVVLAAASIFALTLLVPQAS